MKGVGEIGGAEGGVQTERGHNKAGGRGWRDGGETEGAGGGGGRRDRGTGGVEEGGGEKGEEVGEVQ